MTDSQARAMSDTLSTVLRDVLRVWPRSLAEDIDATRARLAETLAKHDSRDMPEDVWMALADAHHYLTAADSYLRRAQRTESRVVADDE